MILNEPQQSISGTTMYGYHSKFEILRVDDDKANIVAIGIKPTELNVGDAVFYGITGSFWQVEKINGIRGNVVDVNVTRFKNLNLT
jgi:hypothetical protein